jgi:hypothetical protein
MHCCSLLCTSAVRVETEREELSSASPMFALEQRVLLVHIVAMESVSKLTTSVMLQPELRERLDDEAARLDRSRSWVVSRAIADFLFRSASGGAPITAAVASPLGGGGPSAMPGPPTRATGRDSAGSSSHKGPAR